MTDAALIPRYVVLVAIAVWLAIHVLLSLARRVRRPALVPRAAPLPRAMSAAGAGGPGGGLVVPGQLTRADEELPSPRRQWRSPAGEEPPATFQVRRQDLRAAIVAMEILGRPRALETDLGCGAAGP
jgi:hypothetical protein